MAQTHTAQHSIHQSQKPKGAIHSKLQEIKTPVVRRTDTPAQPFRPAIAPQTPGNGQIRHCRLDLSCLCGRRKAAAPLARQDRLLFPTGTEQSTAGLNGQT